MGRARASRALTDDRTGKEGPRLMSLLKNLGSGSLLRPPRLISLKEKNKVSKKPHAGLFFAPRKNFFYFILEQLVIQKVCKFTCTFYYCIL
jgi:hypothetical protein